MNIPLSAFTKEQIALMQPGQRWDIAGQWKFWVFAHSVGASDWTDRGMTLGSREEIVAREPAMLAGLQAMIGLGFIDGFFLFTVPAGWDAKLGDNLLVFPDSLT